MRNEWVVGRRNVSGVESTAKMDYLIFLWYLIDYETYRSGRCIHKI